MKALDITIPQTRLLLHHLRQQIMVCSGYDRSNGFQEQGPRSQFAGFTKTDHKNALAVERKLAVLLLTQEAKGGQEG